LTVALHEATGSRFTRRIFIKDELCRLPLSPLEERTKFRTVNIESREVPTDIIFKVPQHKLTRLGERGCADLSLLALAKSTLESAQCSGTPVRARVQARTGGHISRYYRYRL